LIALVDCCIEALFYLGGAATMILEHLELEKAAEVTTQNYLTWQFDEIFEELKISFESRSPHLS
jgi:hypothetical protein